MSDERKKDPSLAKAILSPATENPDAASLTERIRKLKSEPKENEPSWWNDLAGAHLRLGQPAEAVKILEPLTNRFANNYGIHANLGTAYHLLGRYSDAEREIARDLEINPAAHFGLEKYHLALLQYLNRDADYRLRHVFVDEFTISFLIGDGFYMKEWEDGYFRDQALAMTETERKQEEMELKQLLQRKETMNRTALYDAGERFSQLAQADEPPGYRRKWNLAKDPKLDEGVIYMASLNQHEPACWVMLGVLAVKRYDKNLTVAAFEKAIQLGSPQAPILQAQIDGLRKHIVEAQLYKPKRHGLLLTTIFASAIAAAIAYFVFDRRRRIRRNAQSVSAQ